MNSFVASQKAPGGDKMAAVGRRHGVECGRKEERQSASPSAMITRAQNMCLKAEEATRAAERRAEDAALEGNPPSTFITFLDTWPLFS